MRELQIFILDLQGNQLGELELTDSDDFALKLSKSLASINDIGRRNTSYSLDFEAPETKSNNKLLSGLKFATATKEVLGKKPCAIIVDGNQFDTGFLYAYESTYEGMYRLNFKGDNNDWVERLRDLELHQLKWRDYLTGLRTVDAKELFDVARVNDLNVKNSTEADLIYPLVNRNNNGAFTPKRPQLHLRSILLAMFEEIGYTISSSFLDGDWVQAGANGIGYTDSYGNAYTHLGLSVDPAFQMTRDQQDILDQAAEYKTTGIPFINDPTNWALDTMMGNLGTPTVPNQRNIYRFPTLINSVVLDNNTRFNIPTSEFTVGLRGVYSLEFMFNYHWSYWDVLNDKWQFSKKITTSPNNDYSQISPANQPTPPNFKWYIVKNNTSNTAIDGTILYSYSTSLRQRNVQTGQRFHEFNSGDKISLFLELIDDASGFPFSTELNALGFGGFVGSLDKWRLRMEDDAILKIVLKEDVEQGDEFRINTHIPEGIKCLTLLQDFKTMFNLYFDVDTARKIVVIEPRDDFYTGNVVDITDKIDLNTDPKLNYLTKYKNEMVFEYVKDPADKYLEQWNKINDNTYGQYKYLFNNNERFEKGQNTLSTTLISATIQGNLETKNNYPEITSVIKQEYLDLDNVGKPVNKNYGLRVFQLVNGKQHDPSGVLKKNTVETVAIMEDYANTPTFEDRRLTFNATNGLVEQFYAKTLANIEDTTILTLKAVLSLYEYYGWNLRDIFHISAPEEIAGYYITDAIKNFNVTKETTTSVELVKFKDFDPVAIAQGIGNVNVITQTTPQPQEIMCTVNGVIVSCLDNNLNKMYKK